MLNTHSGEVSYVVLKINKGFLNLGSKLLALPWESFGLNPAQDDVVIVKESKEALENSPGFDEDNWPTDPQSEFIQSIHPIMDMKTEVFTESELAATIK
jgi:hypothetical protein